MKNVLILLILISIFLFTGCPYNSDVPIDEPNIKVDISFLGRWQDATGNATFSGSDGTYIVTKKSENIYGIETSNPEDGEKSYFDAHVSDVSGIKFINVKKLNEEESKFYLYKMEVAGNNCILTEVSMCINQKFNKSSDLKSFITKNLNNDLLYFNHVTFFKN